MGETHLKIILVITERVTVKSGKEFSSEQVMLQQMKITDKN